MSVLLELIKDPQIAYLIFTTSIALLFFELTHPGVVAPGVVGAIGLILSVMSMHQAGFTWGGFALIWLGIGLLVTEAFVPSFGSLGIGGTIAVGIGSYLLFEPSEAGARIPLSTIVPVTVFLGAIMGGIGYLGAKTLRMGKAKPEIALIDKIGKVMSVDGANHHLGMIEVLGERWSFHCHEKVRVGDKVKVIEIKDLRLVVRQVHGSEIEN